MRNSPFIQVVPSICAELAEPSPFVTTQQKRFGKPEDVLKMSYNCCLVNKTLLLDEDDAGRTLTPECIFNVVPFESVYVGGIKFTVLFSSILLIELVISNANGLN